MCINRAKECSGLALLWIDLFGIYFAVKAAKDWRWRWVMVPGIGVRFGLFEDD